jgi:hypothetical protein
MSKTAVEFSNYQLSTLKSFVKAKLAETQAIIDGEGPTDHPLTNQLLWECALLERIREAERSIAWVHDNDCPF